MKNYDAMIAIGQANHKGSFPYGYLVHIVTTLYYSSPCCAHEMQVNAKLHHHLP